MKRAAKRAAAAMIALLAGALVAPVAAQASDGEPYPDVENPLDCGTSFTLHARRLRPTEEIPARASGYHFASDLMLEVAEIREQWPGVVSVECVGRSERRRPMWAITVRNPTLPVQRRVLVFGQLHALEWLGSEVVLATLRELAEAPPKGIEVVLMPVLNPDGRLSVEADLVADRTGVYRRGNSHHVDLNRDFAVNREATSLWAGLPFFGPYFRTSPAPLSQAETQVLDAVAATGFDASISLHAFGNYIFYPWSGTAEPTADNERIVELAQAMAQAQGASRGFRIVQLGRWAPFFKAHGSEIDHLYGAHGAASYLMELSGSGIELFDRSTWGDYFRWYNPRDPSAAVEDGVRGVLGLIRRLALEVASHEPGVHGGVASGVERPHGGE